MKLDRYSFIGVIVVLFFIVLVYFYARLTLVEGAMYRKISDEKRIREIITTPPRGEILDRNGELLAGNKASFTVQLQKDNLNALSKSERNEISISLIRLLEKDGVDYLDDFPIILHKLHMDGDEESFIINQVLENGLIKEFLGCDREYYNQTQFYKFTIGDRILKAIEAKEGEVPLFFIKGEDFLLTFKEGINLEEFFQAKGIDSIDDPYTLLEYYIREDETYAKKALMHSVARKSAYDFLRLKGLAGSLRIKDYSLSFDENYENQKNYLKGLSLKVTDTSSATDDFCNIFDELAFDSFIEKIYPIDENKKAFSVQREAVRFLSEEGIETNIEVSLSKDEKYHLYNYRNNFEPGDERPGQIILRLLRENDLVREFIIQDDIRFLAQRELIDQGINIGISILDVPFEYTSLREKRDFLMSENLLDEFTVKESSLRVDRRREMNKTESAESLFYLLREKYEIDSELSDYEARALLSLNRLVKGQGFLAYQPINFAYGVSDETVATILESFGERKGVMISVEPVRYYPYNNVGSHILGYIGKISQAGEIENYVKEKGYQKSDFIGKIGLEQAMEDSLRGTPGRKVIEVDAVGNTTNELEESLGSPGETIVSTIDINLQKFAEEKLVEVMKAMRDAGTYESPWGNYKYQPYRTTKNELKNPNANTGVAIVQKVNTGEILAMASVPSFNPNLFSTGISTEDFQSLFPENEEDLLAPRPLLNIATQTAIQPGSVFKMATALSALEKGWNKDKRILDGGYVDIGRARHRCWYYAQYGGATHGRVNLADAIENSCNYYFYSLALGENQRTRERLGMQVSIDDINEMSKKLGFGERTGLEIKVPSEQRGSLPSRETKKAIAKARLNNYLRNNIEKYVADKILFNKEEAIREILSWLDEEKEKSRGDVIRGLGDLGLEPLKPLPGRREGLSDLIKFTYFADARWTISNTLNVTIGQGEIASTPLQVSNYISTILNGGRRYKTSLVSSVIDEEGIKHNKKPEYEETMIKEDNLLAVRKGMEQVVEESYLTPVFSKLPITMGAKTGSAEKSGINPATGEEYTAFAWFTCYAPVDEPEIAVTVMVFQGRTGSNLAPVARDIVAKYFKLTPPEEDGMTIQSSGNQE